jgi:NADH:ubiquinone oxidoreductase subunit F (NADH-binding)
VPEKRIVLKNCGIINPSDISTYIARDGFKALEKALALSPEQVIKEVKDSGLRGRGGAGFPCGLKWELTRKAKGQDKYLICNADEGEVGTFKDQYILRSDPYSLIEGIAIAGYALGAKQAFIYLRGEYHHLLKTLNNAINQVKDKGYLKHINIEIREGAGAYICGEESALMDSIEGRRGEARYKPPFPTDSGLWHGPTVINNVETLMNISQIILHGAAWFSQMGTERSKGTKVFSVSGDVARPGVYELVLGSSLKELITDLSRANNIKVVQIGGATGRLLPGEEINTPLSFESYLGAGSITVFDDTRDIIEIVGKTMEFLAEESCGKCTPCREGTEVLTEIMDKFRHGEGTPSDIKVLTDLSNTMMLASLCGLGQAAPNAIIDSLQYFKTAYESRIPEKLRGVKA